ncbi:hypothetical protein [Granulicella arctica]|nr:hypothetical protein [Granulicella arctica]
MAADVAAIGPKCDTAQKILETASMGAMNITLPTLGALVHNR